MAKLVNRVKMTTATTGTGTITLGSAVDGFQSFAAAGVTDGDVVRYVIEDGNSWEIGSGIYTASGTTLTRTVDESSNSDAAINLSGNAVVFVSAAETDIVQLDKTQTLSGKTLEGAVLNDGYTEEVYDLGTTIGPSLTPTDGSIQTWTLDTNQSPFEGTWASGQSLTLLVEQGQGGFSPPYTINWSTFMTVEWKTDRGSAPTLNDTGITVIVLWKVGSTIYGARVGDA